MACRSLVSWLVRWQGGDATKRTRAVGKDKDKEKPEAIAALANNKADRKGSRKADDQEDDEMKRREKGKGNRFSIFV